MVAARAAAPSAGPTTLVHVSPCEEISAGETFSFPVLGGERDVPLFIRGLFTPVASLRGSGFSSVFPARYSCVDTSFRVTGVLPFVSCSTSFLTSAICTARTSTFLDICRASHFSSWSDFVLALVGIPPPSLLGGLGHISSVALLLQVRVPAALFPDLPAAVVGAVFESSAILASAYWSWAWSRRFFLFKGHLASCYSGPFREFSTVRLCFTRSIP